jgi:alpha-beta hydrolase superfamily lysophospholipase
MAQYYSCLTKHTPQGIPIVIMGYSYGFSLVVHALNELTGKHASIENIIRKRVALVIGLNPAFKVGHTASPFIRFFAPVFVFFSRHIKNIPFKSIEPDKITDDEQVLNIIETDPNVFKGKINVQTARNVHIAGKTALRILPTIKLPFLLMFGSEDFVQPVTTEETNNREDIHIRIIRGGKHNIFDGNNIYAGRTLESIMRAIDQYS